MRVLLVGGSGTLGQDLQAVFGESGHETFAPPHKDVDLLYPDRLRKALDVTGADAVVNAAALADVDRCEREPDLAFQVNGDGVRYLAAVCRERNVHLVQVSTDYVFDGKKGEPYLESDKVKPIQVYGKSKLNGERNALQTAGKAAVVRTSWLFGRHGKNFANRVIQAAREGGEVKAVEDWFGSPTSTVDLSRAILALVEKGATGTFHVTNPGVQSRLEQAREILAAIGEHRATITPVAAATLLNLPARRPRYTALASERLAPLGLTVRDRAAAVREFVAPFA